MDGTEIKSEINFGMGPILQDSLPEVPWIKPHTRRLPGIEPLDPADWLRVDEVFNAQMALRDLLCEKIPDDIMACLPEGRAAAVELLSVVLNYLSGQPGYTVGERSVRRADGVIVAIEDPIPTLLRLTAEDFCILVKSGDEHVLVGAALAFPEGWTLSQKLGRAMISIHKPVDTYVATAATRVQRLFDGMRPGQGLVRTNALHRSRPQLYEPKDEFAPPSKEKGVIRPFIRSERQCLNKLPETGAVIFSIHTRIINETALSHEQAKALAEFPIGRESR